MIEAIRIPSPPPPPHPSLPLLLLPLPSISSSSHSLKSVSYDIMKQKGDWQCGGKTHEEHGETYDEFFLRQVEELATHLETAAHLDRAQAKHLLCQLFQVREKVRFLCIFKTPFLLHLSSQFSILNSSLLTLCLYSIPNSSFPYQTIHERCKERVVDRMRSTLTEVTSVSGTSERSAEEAESLHDASRAYGLLLHSSHLRETQEHSEISRQVGVRGSVEHTLSSISSESGPESKVS